MRFFFIQRKSEIALNLFETGLRVGQPIETRSFRPRVDSTNLTNVIRPHQSALHNDFRRGPNQVNVFKTKIMKNKKRSSWNILGSEDKILNFVNFGNAIRMGDIEEVKQTLDEYGIEILSRREIFMNVSFRSKNPETDGKEMDVLFLTPFHLGLIEIHLNS